MREAEKCPICGTKSNWISNIRCYCPECYIEFNPKTQAKYSIDERGRLTQIRETSTQTKRDDLPKHIGLKKKGKPRSNGEFTHGLKYWRLKNNLSTSELAERIGRAPYAINKWENCRSIVSNEMIGILSSVLNVPIAELLKEYSHFELNEIERQFKKERCYQTRRQANDTDGVLKKIRIQSKLSQAEFGRRIHRSNSYAYRLEADPNVFLNRLPEEQKLIAEVLNVDLEELISEIRKEIKK